MKQTSEQAPGKKKSAPRADPKVLILGCRRTLNQKPDPNSPPWAEIISVKLYEIGCDKEAPVNLRLQAIRTAIELCHSQLTSVPKSRYQEPESKSARASLRPTPEEEALSDEELDAQIAELQAFLGSVPESGS